MQRRHGYRNQHPTWRTGPIWLSCLVMLGSRCKPLQLALMFREIIHLSRYDHFFFSFSESIRSLAAGPDEAGFWPVISRPSAIV
jgi:hypothetical protein